MKRALPYCEIAYQEMLRGEELSVQGFAARQKISEQDAQDVFDFLLAMSANKNYLPGIHYSFSRKAFFYLPYKIMDRLRPLVPLLVIGLVALFNSPWYTISLLLIFTVYLLAYSRYIRSHELAEKILVFFSNLTPLIILPAMLNLPGNKLGAIFFLLSAPIHELGHYFVGKLIGLDIKLSFAKVTWKYTREINPYKMMFFITAGFLAQSAGGLLIYGLASLLGSPLFVYAGLLIYVASYLELAPAVSGGALNRVSDGWQTLAVIEDVLADYFHRKFMKTKTGESTSGNIPGAFKFWEKFDKYGMTKARAGRIEGAIGAAGYLTYNFFSLWQNAPPSLAVAWPHLAVPAVFLIIGFFFGHLFGVYGDNSENVSLTAAKRIENAVRATWVATKTTLPAPMAVSILLSVAATMHWLAPLGIMAIGVIVLATSAFSASRHGKANDSELVTAIYTPSFVSGEIGTLDSQNEMLKSPSVGKLLERAAQKYFALDPANFSAMGVLGRKMKLPVIADPNLGLFRFLFNLSLGRYASPEEAAVRLPLSLLNRYVRTATDNTQEKDWSEMVLVWAIGLQGEQRRQPVLDWQAAVAKQLHAADPLLQETAGLLQPQVFNHSGVSPDQILVKSYERLLGSNEDIADARELDARLAILQTMQTSGFGKIKVTSASGKPFVLPKPISRQSWFEEILIRRGVVLDRSKNKLQRQRERFLAMV
ncbi:MAG: hypothetical protein HGA76_09610 [Candidatus Firestonebacteria bacterium]|nr:hypothetical protein [Candidatus Firestonebacteria bacterium]